MAGDDESGAGGTADFGFRRVPLRAKQGLVDEVFHKVARRYDLMNDLMSGGLHRLWKDALVAMLRPSRTRPFLHLDVAGGTGDVARRVLDAGGPDTRATVLDINAAMLREGRARAERRAAREGDGWGGPPVRPGPGRLAFVQSDATALPFPDRSFDGYTVAFGIRNVPRIPLALAEARRVLKPGGRFLCLEFAPVDTPGLDRLYDAYSFNVIPRLGALVTGDGEPYRYLVESIRRHPRPRAFAGMMREAGLERADWRALTGGIAVIHSGWRL